MSYHSLLERQLRKCFGKAEDAPVELHPLLNLISDAYESADRDQRITEHALDEMSRELTERNNVLRRELAEKKVTELALQREKDEQAELIQKLESAQEQLLQSEKLASIGQLAAGVAHEINNPVGYVSANVGTLEKYLADLFALIEACQQQVAALPSELPIHAAMSNLRQQYDLEFLLEDVPTLVSESKEGLIRVRKIVQDLREFSHSDEGRFSWSDLHQGIDSTLNMVNNEIKYKADVVREYGNLPQIQCNLSQLNQVFVNLLVNASHAIPERGTITVRTGQDDDEHVWIEVADTGCGIAEENFKKIFDPFFTTKPVGKGTGLGLSLSYGIIQRHNGQIEVSSTVGAGTTFRITLPVHQPEGN